MLIKELRKALLVLVFLVPGWLPGQVKVTQLTDTTGFSSKGALIYNLPRTRVLLDITLTKTTREKGPFSEYAKDFLGIENVVTRNSVEYKVTAVELGTVPEPDPLQYYAVEKKKSFPWINRQRALVMTSPNGYLLSYNMMDHKQAFSKGSLRNRFYTFQPQDNSRTIQTFYHINDALLSAKEKNLKVDSSIRLPLRRPVYKVEVKDLTPVEKARIALDNLSLIQENIRNLAGGYQEVAYESGTMELMIRQLKEEQQDLLNQFTGISRDETYHYTISYLPDNTRNQSGVIAWFSRQNGLSLKPAEGTLPVTINFKATVPPENTVQNKKSSRQSLGLTYRIPFSAECTVTVGEELLYAGCHTINQFGKVVQLPRQIKKAVFYPETGGLKRGQ